VLRVAFILDLALNNLLLEGRILGKENEVFSMLFGYLNSNLHGVLLSVCNNYTTKSPISQPKSVVKEPHSPGEVPGRYNQWPYGRGLLLQGLVARTGDN
jgi:hypothetical protein